MPLSGFSGAALFSLLESSTGKNVKIYDQFMIYWNTNIYIYTYIHIYTSKLYIKIDKVSEMIAVIFFMRRLAIATLHTDRREYAGEEGAQAFVVDWPNAR